MDTPLLIRIPLTIILSGGAVALLRAAYLASERFFYSYAQLDRPSRFRLAFLSSFRYLAAFVLGVLAYALLALPQVEALLMVGPCLGALMLFMLPLAFLGTLWQGYSSEIIFGGLMRSIARSQRLPPTAALDVRLNPVRGGKRLTLRLVMAVLFGFLVTAVLYLIPLALRTTPPAPLLLTGGIIAASILGGLTPELVDWSQRRRDLYQQPPNPEHEGRQSPREGA
jgi:hypothetical protein